MHNLTKHRGLTSKAAPLLFAILPSVAAWTILFAALPPPKQDVPLIDDWAFARGVFRFASGEGIHYIHWASMPQLGQWLWALPFVWGLGKSHVALRISTIVLSWLGLGAYYDLLRHNGSPRRRAALATATLAFCPLFFLLQGTFMTDVPALSFALMALALYNRALNRTVIPPTLTLPHKGGGDEISAPPRQGGWNDPKAPAREREGTKWLLPAAAAATLAAVTRQNMVIVPVAAAILLARRPQLRGRWAWLLAVLVPLGAGVAVQLWFQARSDVKPMSPRLRSLSETVILGFVILHSCGLAATPVLLSSASRLRSKYFLMGLILMAAGAFYCLQFGGPPPGNHLFPYIGDMITVHGAYSGATVIGPRPVLMDKSAEVVLTILGCLGGAALLAQIFQRVGERRAPDVLVLFTLMQALLILVTPTVYDRYLLMLIPGALAAFSFEQFRGSFPSPLVGEGQGGGSQETGDLETAPALTRIAESDSRWQWAAGIAAWIGFATISVCLMHDWLAWNSALWTLGQRALARQVDPWDIEGGFEWDGWHAPEARPSYLSVPYRGFRLPMTHGFFRHVAGRYAPSFTHPPGTLCHDTEPYTQWLPPGKPQFFFIEYPQRSQFHFDSSPRARSSSCRIGSASAALSDAAR